jgi:hypothetical protein
MPRQQHDREDMLAEAKALVERASLKLPGYDEEVFVGFRRDGSASFYFGPESVYQVTSSGRLRRAFVDGLLYKAEHGRLVALRRRRTEAMVELVRHELSAGEERNLVNAVRLHLDALREALHGDTFELVGQFPDTTDVAGRVRQFLERFAGPLAIAASPRSR